MKIKSIILIIVITCIMTGCSCGYEKTQEYELITIRLYTEKDESGLFTTKTNEHTRIEISYQAEDGIKTETIGTYDVNVGENTMVVEEEGELTPTIYLTKEDYNKLYGIVDGETEVSE